MATTLYKRNILHVLFVLIATLFLKTEIYGEQFFRRTEMLKGVAAKSQGLEENDYNIVKRVMQAYQQVADNQQNQGELWQGIFNNHRVGVHQAIMQGKFEEVATILRNPGSTNLFWGIDNLAASILSGRFSDPVYVQHHATNCLDGLVRLAEAIGAIRLDVLEGHSIYKSPWESDVIIKKIEETLGHKLSFPNPYPGEHGCWSSQGIVSYRAPQALYQAWRIKQLLGEVEHPRVLEIGAGVGRTAFYAHLLGIEDYTIVDLPMTGVISSYFLARTLGEDRVVMFRENTSYGERKIKMMTPDEFLTSTDSYDLIVNADSLTEMDLNIAHAYFERIAVSAPIFLSINHELNKFTVNELIDTSSQVDLVDRVPYWMRNGYVEEVVRFKRTKK